MLNATKIAIAILCLYRIALSGQVHPPIEWTSTITQISPKEIQLSLNATMGPGWHLYSQYLKEGGPQPTQIVIDEHSGYEGIGKATEKGKKETYYDDIYEMEITSYSINVQFQQKVKVNQYSNFVTGYVNYMICNNQVCVPKQHEFAIDATKLKKTP